MKLYVKFAPFVCLALLAQSANAFETAAKQAILVDSNTNTTLYAKEADSMMYPSSMTKIMTVYLAFERLKEGALTLDSEFYVSEKAWKMQGSKMFIHVGDYVKVGDLLRGIIVQSGNDACIALAEGLAGSEEAFAEMMNAKAKELGMTGSHFVDASGWPHEDHYTTARDLVILSQAMIRDFPEYYPMWAEREFTYNNITQPNRNTLLGEMGVDGLKTGHTEIAGYGITVSGEINGRRLIAVVNGLNSMAERINEARSLLSYGFRAFQTVEMFKPGDTVHSAKVWFGKQREVALTVKEPVMVTLPVANKKNIKLEVVAKEPLPAPVPAGAQVAELRISAPEMEAKAVPLYTAQAVEQMSAFERLFPTLRYRLFGTY